MLGLRQNEPGCLAQGALWGGDADGQRDGVRRVPLSAGARHAVVVADPALEAALRPWVSARTQQGWTVQFVPTAEARSLPGLAPSHVLLVGHPRGEGAFHLPMTEHAPPYRHMRTAYWGDHAWTHGDLAQPPRHAVGRLPVKNHGQLESLLRKVLAPPPPVEPRVHFVDGHPQWHPFINRASHVLATWSARMPLPVGVQAGRASFNPFSVGGAQQEVDRWLASSGLLWVYVGHGQPHSVDGLNITNLPAEGGQHLAAVLACCHAGTLHAESPGLAESWLLRPAGPRAILAATNVSDPRLNPALALAFAITVLTPGATVGDAVLSAREALGGARTHPLFAALRLFAPPAIRRAHQGIYNLLGDPTLELRRRAKVASTAKSG